MATKDTGEALKPSPTVDLTTVWRWRQTCSNTHGDCCNDRYSEALARHLDHLILVDVINNSLVRLSTSMPTPFVALSYVWGNVPMLKTKGSNFEELQQPGALCNAKNRMLIPDTIRDAMYLVGALGERYLWVDCLCVIQDSAPEEMDTMLRAMANIYASAELTIVAAAGSNAAHGLEGVGGPSQNRTPLDNRFAFNRNFPGGYPMGSKWASRGWTFQESLFSRRLLIFDTRVSWSCGRCDWREGLDEVIPVEGPYALGGFEWPAERPHLGVPMGMMSLIPQRPSLGRWGMLIENFTSRALTYDKDVHSAFAGATEVMGSTFPGNLLHGIPRFFFDIALLWQPKTYLSRRTGEPSWSWTGWKGDIDCLSSWYPFFAGLFRKSDRSSDWVAIAPLKPVAKYREETSFSNETNQHTRFNGFYKYQALRKDQSMELPMGWKRHHDPCGDYFTNATSSPGSKYGFPLPTATEIEEQPRIAPSPILHCTAPYAKLRFGKRVKSDDGTDPRVTLRDGDKDVGVLNLQTRTRSLVEILGRSCELIVVSEAETAQPKRLAELAKPKVEIFEKDKKMLKEQISQETCEGIYCFYNVMWIKWVGDVAERRALGIVHKEAWHALDTKIITFKLG
jgi:hypothetical protein